MKNFNRKLQVAYQNAYQSAYHMEFWKGLAIYPKAIEERSASEFSVEEKTKLTRKGLRWYVYYKYLNPETNKFDKIIAPTLGLNRDHTKFDDRHKAFRRLRDSVKQMLQEGFSPFDISVEVDEIVSMEKALDLSLANKKIKVSEDTFKSYEIRVNQLKEYLSKKGVLKSDANTFRFKVLRDFLNQVAKDSSMANRNNVLRALKAVFTDMYKNEYIQENYLKRIDIEKTENNRFKTYSKKQMDDILEHLEEHHPVMCLYIKFIGFNFLRPKEVSRLKVSDLDLENKLLSVFVKQGSYKTKRIPDEIIEDLSKYDLSNKDNLLFGMNEISGKWDRGLTGRRSYYSEKFSKIKTFLKFGKGYTMYSSRHTYITIGYKNLRKRMSKDEALDTLMEYTGHDSRASIKKYIHYVDAEIVPEYKGEVI